MTDATREVLLKGATIEPEPLRPLRQNRAGRWVQEHVGADVKVDPQTGLDHLTIPAVDYVGNHAAAIAAGRVRADVPPPIVKRYKREALSHDVKDGSHHEFLATFDASQQLLLCPECGGEVHVPANLRYREP